MTAACKGQESCSLKQLTRNTCQFVNLDTIIAVA